MFFRKRNLKRNINTYITLFFQVMLHKTKYVIFLMFCFVDDLWLLEKELYTI